MEDLRTKFGIPELILLVLQQELRATKTDANVADIPAIAEKILSHLEAICALQESDAVRMPHKTTMQVFRALRLNAEEQTAVLPFITQQGGVPRHEIRDYVRKRFEMYSLLTRKLHQATKDYVAGAGSGPTLPRTHNAMGQLEEGRRKGRRKRGDQPNSVLGARAGLEEKEEDKRTPGYKPKHRSDRHKSFHQGSQPPPTPHCGYCKSSNKDPGHWPYRCPVINCTHKAQLKALHMCLGCLRQKPAPPGVHKCPDWMTDPSKTLTGQMFCSTCSVNIKLCSHPSSHQQQPIPVSFLGAAFNISWALVMTANDAPVTPPAAEDAAILTNEPANL